MPDFGSDQTVLRKTHWQRQKCKEGVIVNTKVDRPQGLERQKEEIRIVKLCYTKRGWFGCYALHLSTTVVSAARGVLVTDTTWVFATALLHFRVVAVPLADLPSRVAAHTIRKRVLPDHARLCGVADV